MKHKMVIAVLTAAILIPASAISLLAQDVKIGYIDSIKIFADYRETQDAERLYRQEVDQWTAQKQRMEQDIVKMRDELQAQSLMLSEEKKAEKKLELDRKMAEYEQFMQETFGDDGLAARRNKELTQPIVAMRCDSPVSRVTCCSDQDVAVLSVWPCSCLMRW